MSPNNEKLPPPEDIECLIHSGNKNSDKDSLVQSMGGRDRKTILLMRLTTLVLLLFTPILFLYTDKIKDLVSFQIPDMITFNEKPTFPKDGSWTLHEHDHAITGANGTCSSMRERFFYYPPSQLHFTPQLKQRLREYEKMHKRCVSGVRNWDEHFKVLEDGKEDCRYLVWAEITSGLGNRLGSLMSAFTYALLTDRALLVDTRNNIEGLICDPFPYSSWWLPSIAIIEELTNSPKVGDYLKEVELNGGRTTGIEKNSLLINMQHWYNEDDAQLYCDYSQIILDNVVWMAFDSNQNTIPAFYFVSRFRDYLNELIPDRAVLTHLSRYLLNPTNSVWSRITRVYDGYIRNADSKIGLQVRVGAAYDGNVSERIIACLGENKLVPEITSDLSTDSAETKQRISLNKPNSITNLFVASLDVEYYADLKEFYGRHTTFGNRIITVHTESTASKIETHNLDSNQLALSEIWLLSLSDTLLITYHSTFGYLASALAGRETYFMNICELSMYNELSRWKLNNRPVCEPAWSYNGCFHSSPKLLQCNGKTVYKKADSTTWLPYIRNCQDESYGIVLIPSL